MKFLYLSFSNFTAENQLVVEETYGPHPNYYFEMLNLKIGERILVTRCFGFHSDFRDTD